MSVGAFFRGMGILPVRLRLKPLVHGREAHATVWRVVMLLLGFALMGATQSTSPSTTQVRFRTIDIFLDPHNQKLAAYQIEFIGESDTVKLVGIEGGEHAAFNQPPYYDRKALMQNRAILAGLNAGDDLPARRTRIARLHVQMTAEHPEMSVKLIVAANSDGTRIPADVSMSEGATP